MATAPARVPPPHGPGCRPTLVRSQRFPGEVRHICTATCPRSTWIAATTTEAEQRHQARSASLTNQESTMAAATQDKKPAKAPDTGADAAAKRAERSAKKVPQRGTGRVLMLKRDQIVVRKEFNPRTSMEKEALAELAASIEQRGLLQAITVRPDTKGKDRYFLLGGHRRVAAGDQVGVKEYPAVVRESDERDELVDAFIDNRLREDLTPLEEAKTFHRLKEGGLTVKGIADSCTVSEKLVHDRLAILELPPGIQKHYGDGTLPTGTVRPLVAMAKISGQLAAKVVNDALDDRRHGISPGTIAQNPEQWAVQAAMHIKGLYIIDWQGKVSDADLLPWDKYKGGDTLTTADDMPRLIKAMSGSNSWDRYVPRLTKPGVDTLRAAGVLYGGSKGDGEAVINDAQSLMAVVEPVVRRDHAAYLKRQAEHRAATRKGGDAAAAADEKAKEYQQQVDARQKNLALGDVLVSNLGNVNLTMDVAKFLCYALLEGSYGGVRRASELGMAGLRYVLPSWQQEKQLKNGKVKVTYASTKSGSQDLEKMFWEWLGLAATPQELIGRTLIIYAAAQYADTTAVPPSQRFPSGTGLASTHDYQTGRSEPKVALQMLERIVKPHLPKQPKPRQSRAKASSSKGAAEAAAPEPVIVFVKPADGVKGPPVEAELQSETNGAQPQLRKVIYTASRTGAWIHKDRIVEGGQQTTVTEQVAKAAAPKSRAAKDPRRVQALEMITGRPGITIPELASAMGVAQNTLYRLLPALAEEKLILKSGNGWHQYTSPGTEPNPGGIAGA